MTELATVVASMTGLFDDVKGAGITIITSAIGLGVIFLGGKWLWGKTRQWLSKV